MTVSVIIPSRLAENPLSEHGSLYLDRALMSVRRQQHRELVTQVIVALDPGSAVNVPARFLDTSRDFVTPQFIEAERPGQAAALNAGLAAATGKYVAFLEDDDHWAPRRLYDTYSLAESNDTTLVTCNQREVDPEGNYLRINDFPTPSGWLVRREAVPWWPWFDETFRFHVDTHFLGRANAAGLKRVHVVDADAEGWSPETRLWLAYVSKHSVIKPLTPEPLVTRTANPDGGMGQIARGGEAKDVSEAEHRRFLDLWNEVPW